MAEEKDPKGVGKDLEMPMVDDMDEEVNMRAMVSDLSNDEIAGRIRLLDNNIKIMKSDTTRLRHEAAKVKNKIDENKEKIKKNKQLPWLVSNVVEVLYLIFIIFDVLRFFLDY